MADNRGIFETGCAGGAVPATPTNIASSDYNIAECLVPTYISVLPYDPSDPSASYTSTSSYYTGYLISRDTTTGRITVSASSSELGETISVNR